MINQSDFEQWSKRAKAQTEIYLNRFVPSENSEPVVLHQSMRYATLNVGKRLRPLLVMACAELCDFDEEALAQAVCAVEMIHIFSLVHDDLPAMDNDSLRHGKPSCHTVFGDAVAILTGNTLQALAFETLAQENRLPENQRLQSISTLAKAVGSQGLNGGQVIDIQNLGTQMTQQELEQMHSMKTGALIRCAVRLGVLCHYHVQDIYLEALDDYARHLGLAFQVIDDVLDSSTDEVTLGKTTGKDAEQGKPTFVSLLGIQGAKDYAHQLITQAKHALTCLDAPTLRLEQLADFTLKRSH